MDVPKFLPWIRTGLARDLGGPDDTVSPLVLRSAIEATVTLRDSLGVVAEASGTLPLVGPGDAIGIDSAQVIRMVPAASDSDAESNYLPFVELLAPDLPWLLTPVVAGADNRLRPWLVLVCVEDREGVSYDAAAKPLPVLRLAAADALSELPDLTESYAWTHVQTLVPAPQIEDELASASGAVFVRLMCPRRLRESTKYRAALVPAFDVGRVAGLGGDISGFSAAGPAWSPGATPDPLDLPVYFTWTFTTGAEPGDFEELARRLKPDLDGGRLGFRDATVVDNAILAPFSGNRGFEYEGALVDPGSRGEGLSKDARAWFQEGVRTLIEQGADRPTVPVVPPRGYDPEVDDPVLAPPYYGYWAATESRVPRGGWLDGDGWLRDVNLAPRRRVAAGLGADAVRRHQKELLASAWDQAGQLRELQVELNRGRLAAEVGRSHARRLAALDDAGLVQATARVHTFINDGSATVARKVRRSIVVPNALVSPAYARLTRAGGLIGRRAASAGTEPKVGIATVGRFLAASVGPGDRPKALEPLARLGASFVAAKTITLGTDYRVVTQPASGGSLPSTRVQIIQPTPARRSNPKDDLSAVAMAIRPALDPMPATIASLRERISGIELDTSIDLPTRVSVGPRFPDPLLPWVLERGAEVLLPGLDSFGANRVRLLAVNEPWIASLLVGANTEWDREALWNEYPAGLGATAFSTFWPRVPLGSTDLVSDIHEWAPASQLAAHIGTPDGSTVLLIRGDLVRRYPDVELFLVTPDANGAVVGPDGSIPAERITWPAFSGTLDAQTVFVGFDVDPQLIRGEGRYVAIQEPLAGPRFGLDPVDAGQFGKQPTVWADLGWGHLVGSQEEFEDLTHIRLADVPGLAGVRLPLEPGGDRVTWGRNSAHMAAITFQRPFRLLMPATYLMP